MRRSCVDEERGASAVEFAIVLSVVFIVLFGIIQFGIAFNRYQGLQAAAREGARVASVGAVQNDISSRVKGAQSLFSSADVNVKINYSIDDGATYTNICDDQASPACTSNVAPSPCKTAEAAKPGSLIRVTGTVAADQKYAILIPLWGNAKITYTGQGVFRCDLVQ